MKCLVCCCCIDRSFRLVLSRLIATFDCRRLAITITERFHRALSIWHQSPAPLGNGWFFGGSFMLRRWNRRWLLKWLPGERQGTRDFDRLFELVRRTSPSKCGHCWWRQHTHDPNFTANNCLIPFTGQQLHTNAMTITAVENNQHKTVLSMLQSMDSQREIN